LAEEPSAVAIDSAASGAAVSEAGSAVAVSADSAGNYRRFIAGMAVGQSDELLFGGLQMRRSLLASAFAVCATVAFAADPPAKVTSGALVSPKGMTLYTFDKDVAGSGKSVCNGQCAFNWPPLAAPADAKPTGNWTVIQREGGGAQWAYKGRPLYTFIGDAGPGDNNGKGVNGVWQVATP
jgi:predicted lipoprotein with Yx(FWY)xxD motif